MKLTSKGTISLLSLITALIISPFWLQPTQAADGESEDNDGSSSSEPKETGKPTAPVKEIPPPTRPRSALRLHETKPMPAQLIDFTAYDDVIKFTCEEKPSYLEFPSVKLKPIVKVTISCLCNTKHNQYAPETKYQELWFHKATPIGCKHFTTLPIKEKHEIGIFLKSDRTLSSAEISACASALVRLRLETAVNQNMIVTVRVPNECFEQLKLELQKQNFVSYRENSLNITTLIPLPLETEFGRRETLCFLTNR